MLVSYKRKYPNWNSNQRELFLFVCRAHNTVNSRIDKPIIASVADCIETIKNNIRDTSLKDFRQKYSDYLLGNWSKYHDFDGMHAMSSAREVDSINKSYWNSREVDILSIQPFGGDVTELIVDTGTVQSIGPGFLSLQKSQTLNIGFKMKQGRLTLFGQ
jgi:hypothetical protein